MSTTLDSWIEIGRADDVPEDGTLRVDATEVAIALYKIDGAIYATQAQCTHGNAELVDGFIEGREIICPYHQGRFDIPSGRATAPPCEQALQVHDTRVDDAGRLFVKLSRGGQ